MQAERWLRVQELFDRALEMEAEARPAFLDEACGEDDDLRSEVEGMLEVDASLSPDYFENVVVGGSALLSETFDPILRRGSIGKYKIVEKVGEGGFGMVHRGVDQDLKRDVAIKTCTSSDERLRLRFQREAEISARLQHPNITTVHDLGIEDGIPYLVQEFLIGEDLSHKIESQTPLDTATRLDYLLQMAKGLAHAHKHGVLHRDVKPGNMRVLDNGRLKILDFGIARLVDERNPITTEGVAVGTVGYLSPEQFEGTGVDRRSDIFSFGVVAYELLTQVRPFPGTTFSEVSFKLMYEPPIPMGEHWPDCPLDLEHLVSRCLEKDKQHRYQDFNELIGDLEAVIGQLAGDQPLTTFSQEAERRQRNRWWIMAAGILGLLVLLITGRFLGGGDGAPSPVVESVSQGVEPSLPDPPTSGFDAGDGQPSSVDDGNGNGDDDELGKSEAMVLDSMLLASSEDTGPTLPTAETAAAPPGPDQVAGLEPTTFEPTTFEPTTFEPKAFEPTTIEAPPDGAPLADISTADAAPSRVSKPAAEAPEELPSEGPTRPAISSSGSATSSAELTEPSTSIEGGPAIKPVQEPSQPETSQPEPEPSQLGSTDEPSGDDASEVPSVRPAVEVEPQLLHRGTPIYPRRAYILKLEARVQLLVRVDEQGQVTQTVVKSSTTPNMGFEAAAQKAASKSRFRPGTVDGVPAAAWQELTFEFKYQ